MARTHRRAVVPAEGVLSVFTDGSSSTNPRHGGIGIRYVYVDREGNEEEWDSAELGVQRGRIPEMELLAVVTALKEIQGRRFPVEILERATKIDVYTDSLYVADNVNRAAYEWSKNQWRNRDGRPVQNAELWRDLVRELVKIRRIKPTDIRWAKGHSPGNPHNKAADRLAKESAKKPFRRPLTPSTVRRKKTAEPTEVGSVEMLGQRMKIRIVEAEPMRIQHTNRYRYEVVSPHSPYFGKADFAYSEDAGMRPGHTYLVRMGEDPRYPRFVKCYGERASEPRREL